MHVCFSPQAKGHVGRQEPENMKKKTTYILNIVLQRTKHTGLIVKERSWRRQILSFMDGV